MLFFLIKKHDLVKFIYKISVNYINEENLIKNWLFIVILFITSVNLFADTLYMKDGSKFFGRILNEKKKFIIFKRKGRKVKVFRKKILKYEIDQFYSLEDFKRHEAQKKRILKKINEKIQKKLDDIVNQKKADFSKFISKNFIYWQNNLDYYTRLAKYKKPRKYWINVLGSFGLETSYPDITELSGYKAPEEVNIGFSSKTLDFSFSGGVGFKYFILPFLSLNSSLYYRYKNLKIKWEKESVPADRIMKFQYQFITLSLGGRYYLTKRFYGGLGFLFGLVLGKTQVSIDDGTVEEGNVEEVLPGSKIKNDFGIYFEAGFVFPLSKELNLNTGFRLEGSFTKILDADAGYGVKSLSPRSYMIFVGLDILLH